MCICSGFRTHSIDGIVDKDLFWSEEQNDTSLVGPGTLLHNLLSQFHLFRGAQGGGDNQGAANILWGKIYSRHIVCT